MKNNKNIILLNNTKSFKFIKIKSSKYKKILALKLLIK